MNENLFWPIDVIFLEEEVEEAEIEENRCGCRGRFKTVCVSADC